MKEKFFVIRHKIIIEFFIYFIIIDNQSINQSFLYIYIYVIIDNVRKKNKKILLKMRSQTNERKIFSFQQNDKHKIK